MMRLFILMMVVSTLPGCGPSTKITKSWKEPYAAYKKGESGKIMVMAMVIDAVSRRVIEDQIVKRVGATASQSYLLFSDDMLRTLPPEVFEDKLKRENFKYVLLMRLADVEEETSYVQGSTAGYYGGYGRYYWYGASYYSTPGYYATDKKYFVETTVFSVEPDKLLWSGTTKTVNPSKIEKTVNDIGDVVADRMRRDGFLK